MRIARCLAPDLSIRTIDGFGRRFGRGAFVDLDEPIGDRGLTVAEALGARVALFALVDEPVPDPMPPDEPQE
jgi:hypothetical protein